MAFKGLKRFFSLKKNKTVKKQNVSNPLPLQPISELDDSFAANQLLRSSSTRYAVVNEVDYSSLPPLPHPINHVLPTSSTASLASAATSLSSTSRGTYTVTVHGRKHHTHTEFPNANRSGDHDDEPAQRRNNSQLLGLRSDPSLVSLLSLYDEHGQLPARAFENDSPPKEGRAQVQRSGSTLRQLLGNPASSVNSRDDAGGLEGDISWAERFLGETASMVSSTSSLPTPDTDSPQTPNDDSFLSNENPAISSLEVELSDIAETPPRKAHNSPYIAADPKTPQRASQVFGFLTDKRRSRAPEEDERSLPELPSAFSSPSDADSPPPPRNRSRSHFSSDSSADSIEPPAPVEPAKPTNDVHVIMAHGPTKVIVTAPTPSFHHDNIAASRGPRGPRAHHRQRSSGRVNRDLFTTIPARRHVSRSSSGSISGSLVEHKTSEKTKRRSILAVFEKENHLSAKQELPRTPIRTGSISRPYNRGPRAPASPASMDVSAQMDVRRRHHGYI
ncbi:hypothetical protein C8R45DRAFT_949221 [Mycena sanguinolenta]|nr:hypothetical protein C8R45DRAFT_949221 [Mycena sanguinolenta]